MKEMTIANYLLFVWTPFVPQFFGVIMLPLMSKLVRKLKK